MSAAVFFSSRATKANTPAHGVSLAQACAAVLSEGCDSCVGIHPTRLIAADELTFGGDWAQALMRERVYG